jgi:hypothetical protein
MELKVGIQFPISELKILRIEFDSATVVGQNRLLFIFIQRQYTGLYR